LETMAEGKEHVSIVICGHVDAGKSTTTGRLIFELGGIPEREMQKLRDEADRLGKGSFAFAFYMDRQKEERERGVTISCTTKEFFTATKHYTVIDVALLMIPADGNFTTAIAKGNHKAGEVPGQTRQHALLINLLGVKQLIVGVNKMDADMAVYKEERFNEIRDEMDRMLIRVGWPKKFIEESVPKLPISGWKGDNLITKSTNMDWWKGTDVKLGKATIHLETLLDALEKMVTIPERAKDAVMRTPISGIYKIKGIGDVLTGRVEQGTVRPGEEVIFLPTHTTSTPCIGKVFTVEMHHKSVESASSGDNCGFNIKGLVKENMPRVGDVMILKKDETLRRCKSFTAQIRVLEHPGELKVGYCPIAFVRTGRSAVKMTKIGWKVGKETGNQKVENPISLKSNEMAECTFEPQQPFVVDSFKNCEGLGRVAIMEGASVIMLGKVVGLEFQTDEAKGKAGAPAAKTPGAGKAAPAAGAAAAKPAAKPAGKPAGKK